MDFSKIKAGEDLPNDINVVIEIPTGSSVKYEVDKDSGAIFVDRLVNAFMHYPANYGYIPHTLSEDGDPCDVLVFTDQPLIPGCVIRCRPIGVLNMVDDAGKDEKIIAVPHEKVCPVASYQQDISDMPPFLLDKVKHFFKEYKSLEAGKWSEIHDYENKEAAKKVIQEAADRYNNTK